jgi:hypothetical protein
MNTVSTTAIASVVLPKTRPMERCHSDSDTSAAAPDAKTR